MILCLRYDLNTSIISVENLNLTEKEFKKFKPGDSLWGDSSDPEVLMEWSMEKVEEAKEGINPSAFIEKKMSEILS